MYSLHSEKQSSGKVHGFDAVLMGVAVTTPSIYIAGELE